MVKSIEIRAALSSLRFRGASRSVGVLKLIAMAYWPTTLSSEDRAAVEQAEETIRAYTMPKSIGVCMSSKLILADKPPVEDQSANALLCEEAMDFLIDYFDFQFGKVYPAYDI